MTAIVTWNIQCGLGCDGKVDLDRTARVIRAMGDADVICLQEVARLMPGLGGGADQVADLSGLFPEYEFHFGAALDWAGEAAGKRRRFGNLILSRLPALQAFRHLLPEPSDPSVAHMPRQATEVTVRAAGGPLRILTTHLEFNSPRQRARQVDALRSLHRETSGNARRPGVDPGGGLYARVARPETAVICGDFNFTETDPEYGRLLAPFEDETPEVPRLPRLTDAWAAAHGEKPHAPTCGVFDQDQWLQGAHCRDFFFVTGDLAGRIESLEVDTETDASDHQPLRLTLADDLV